VQAKPYDSHFWRGLLKIKDEVLAKGSFTIKDGSKTRFWDDVWEGQMPFKDKYPSLLQGCEASSCGCGQCFGYKASQFIF